MTWVALSTNEANILYVCGILKQMQEKWSSNIELSKQLRHSTPPHHNKNSAVEETGI